MIFVLDTHALLWFLTENPSPSLKARKIFQEVELGKATMIVPTIVLAEIMYLCGKKNQEQTFYDAIGIISQDPNYETEDLTIEVLLTCKNIENISEMHDKIIMATAKLMHAPLITKDEKIQKSESIVTIW